MTFDARFLQVLVQVYYFEFVPARTGGTATPLASTDPENLASATTTFTNLGMYAWQLSTMVASPVSHTVSTLAMLLYCGNKWVHMPCMLHLQLLHACTFTLLW